MGMFILLEFYWWFTICKITIIERLYFHGNQKLRNDHTHCHHIVVQLVITRTRVARHVAYLWLLCLLNSVSSMVFCSIIGCGHQARRDKCSFRRVPAVLKHQGVQMLELSSEQRRVWRSAISGDDLTEEKLLNVFVCGCHFMGGWFKIVIFHNYVFSTGFLY